MEAATGTLTIPGFGNKVAAKPRVDYQNTPEGVLVSRAQAGEEGAFREIVERYQTKVFSIIHGIVRSAMTWRHCTASICQGLRFHPEFRFPQFADHWIYKITVNECFDYLRKRKVRKLVYESDLSEDEVRRVENSEPAVNGRHRPTPACRKGTTL